MPSLIKPIPVLLQADPNAMTNSDSTPILFAVKVSESLSNGSLCCRLYPFHPHNFVSF